MITFWCFCKKGCWTGITLRNDESKHDCAGFFFCFQKLRIFSYCTMNTAFMKTFVTIWVMGVIYWISAAPFLFCSTILLPSFINRVNISCLLLKDVKIYKKRSSKLHFTWTESGLRQKVLTRVQLCVWPDRRLTADPLCLPLQVPLRLIESVEGRDMFQLHIICKDSKIVR